MMRHPVLLATLTLALLYFGFWMIAAFRTPLPDCAPSTVTGEAR